MIRSQKHTEVDDEDGETELEDQTYANLGSGVPSRTMINVANIRKDTRESLKQRGTLIKEFNVSSCLIIDYVNYLIIGVLYLTS